MTLAPDDTTTNRPGSRLANDNLRGWMRRQGDFGNAPRQVLHYAYPRAAAGAEARSAIARAFRERGFLVSDAAMRDGLVLQHEADVNAERFDALTAEMADLFASFGWDYDGWESAPQFDPALVFWRTTNGVSLR